MRILCTHRATPRKVAAPESRIYIIFISRLLAGWLVHCDNKISMYLFYDNETEVLQHFSSSSLPRTALIKLSQPLPHRPPLYQNNHIYWPLHSFFRFFACKMVNASKLQFVNGFAAACFKLVVLRRSKKLYCIPRQSVAKNGAKNLK